LANFAASVVCSKFGAATVSMNELLESINYSGEFKFIDIEVAKYIIRSLKEKGKKIVFTNGCFDLVHAGHISSFTQAKSMGDILIVAVNSDASVKRLKGDKRPVIDQENRIKMLCALECVDYVLLMEEDTPVNIIRTLEPDVAVKGKDWENKDIPEKHIVESYGGFMRFIELEQGLSTTNIIGKILESNQS
jgi:D-beta-D-heptose 7-phosphate kinase/D-beta-D-heptose 1-phosphate adenosyltransferase